MRSSQAAFDLIVKEEVSSEAVYRKKYQRPEWPGVNSGATVGIGYDLGQTNAATIQNDWKAYVSGPMLVAMVGATGKTGQAGKAATSAIRNKVLIPWEDAIAVHKESVVPRWEARLAKSLPNTDKLHPDCFGALLSLIFNRGTSFNSSGERYKEMRAIKEHMRSQNFAAIPTEFRRMKRIWPGVPGLQGRREREAKLFEKGLKAKPVSNPVRVPVPEKPETKPAIQSKEIWATIGTILTTILGVVTDWRVLSVLVVGFGLFAIYWRFNKDDIRGWFS